MAWKDRNVVVRVVVAALLGALLALPFAVYLKRQQATTEPEQQETSVSSGIVDDPTDSPAWQYARAYQLGDWDTVACMKYWITILTVSLNFLKIKFLYMVILRLEMYWLKRPMVTGKSVVL